MTLGVIASALFLTETGQMPYMDFSTEAQASQTSFQLAAVKPAVSNYLRELATNRLPAVRADAAKQLGILKDPAGCYRNVNIAQKTGNKAVLD